jgi:hypothetical protein
VTGDRVLARGPKLRPRGRAVWPTHCGHVAHEVGQHADRAHDRSAGLPSGRRLLDEGRGAPELISLLKRNSYGKALEIARVARGIQGANGMIDKSPKETAVTTPRAMYLDIRFILRDRRVPFQRAAQPIRPTIKNEAAMTFRK